MKELGYIKMFVGIEERFTRLGAGVLGDFAVDVPIFIGGVGITTEIVRDIGDHELCFGGYVIGLVILEVIIE